MRTFIHDENDMRSSILYFGKQINHALNDIQFTSLHAPSTRIDSVIIVGMGSSLIAYKLIESLYSEYLAKPTFCVNTPSIPTWANKNTLVILSSYSGSSIETLQCARDAVKQGCITVGITTGGELMNILKNKAHFIYKLDKTLLNPCQQPRMTIGFSYGIYLKLLNKLQVLKLPKGTIPTTIQIINSLNIKALEKQAERYSQKLKQHHVYVLSGGTLTGNAELLQKQLNWNSKQFSSLALVPEAMHHIGEGIRNPKKSPTAFCVLTSDLLQLEDFNDLEILSKYLLLNNLRLVKIKIKASSKSELILKGLFISSLISFHLSMLYSQNPTPTPAIEFYKENIKKQKTKKVLNIYKKGARMKI